MKTPITNWCMYKFQLLNWCICVDEEEKTDKKVIYTYAKSGGDGLK